MPRSAPADFVGNAQVPYPVVSIGCRPGCPTLHDDAAPRSPVRSSESRFPVATKSADVRPKITMACTECKERNYITKKNRRNNPDRMELSKFCPRCGKHTAHRETR